MHLWGEGSVIYSYFFYLSQIKIDFSFIFYIKDRLLEFHQKKKTQIKIDFSFIFYIKSRL